MLTDKIRNDLVLFPELVALDVLAGQEVAGEVDALGAGVTGFQPGDRVFGFASSGGLADYALVPAAIAVARGSDLVATVPERHTEALRVGMHTSALPFEKLRIERSIVPSFFTQLPTLTIKPTSVTE